MKRLATIVILTTVYAACATQQTAVFPKAPAGARSGGTITVAIPEPRTIDPSAVSAFDVGGSLVVRTMCDALVSLDPVTGAVRPAIAESWQVADGGGRVSLKLREGVRFSDGRELDADDVAFTLTRAASPETASPASALLSPVKGYDKLRSSTGRQDDQPTLDGVEVLDRYALDITLSTRVGDLYRVMSHPIAMPVQRRAASGDPEAFAARPICAGPYRLTRAWRPGDPTIELERHAGYVAQNAALSRGGRGFADRIVFRIANDPAARLAAFTNREVDATRVDATLVPNARSLADDLVRTGGLTLEYIGLPVTVPPFDRRAVRVALSQALDRSAIARDAFGGARDPASALLPPALGDQLHRTDACGANAPADGRPDGALRTLASAGLSLRGKQIKLYFNDELGNRRIVEAVGDAWKQGLGVVPQLVPLSFQEYLARGRGQPGFDGAFRGSWATEYPSADAYLEPLLSSSSIGQENLTRFSSREFDDLLEREARRAADPEDQKLAFEALEDIACSQMPLIPVVYGSSHDAVRTSRLGSARRSYTDRTTGQLLLRELYVR